VRGQVEVVGLIVMATLLITTMYFSTISFQRAGVIVNQASQLAQLLSERSSEEVYFMASNNTIYARSTVSTRVKEILVYNSTGIVEHVILDIYLPAGNWTQLPLTSSTVSKITSGEAVLLLLTERGNLVTWDPYAESSELNSLIGSGLNSLVFLDYYGYKLQAGSIDMNIYNQQGFKEFLFLTAPVDCSRVRFDAYGGPYWDMVCNCNMSSRFHWLTYGLYGKYTTNPYPPRPIIGENFYFVQNSSLLIIGADLTWSNNYFQVYRLLKYVGNTPIQFNVTIKVRGYYYLGSTQYPLTLDFIPVVYIYDATTSPLTPVSLGRGSSDTFKPWLKRIPLESSYISTSSSSFWSKTYTARIDPSTVSASTILILVGVEAVKVTSMTGYIEVEITVSY
jgi:hypothetical protein